MPVTRTQRIFDYVRLTVGYIALAIMVAAIVAFTVWFVVSTINDMTADNWWMVFGLPFLWAPGVMLIMLVPGAIATACLDYDRDAKTSGFWPNS